ncbi:MAG TPA: hypothetical protein PLU22_07055 [Polyangiaceae bacterium]|nr:hypothetical protein [Polyangiaceae bacterium]
MDARGAPLLLASLLIAGRAAAQAVPASPPPPPEAVPVGAGASAEPAGPSPLLGLGLDEGPPPEPWIAGGQLGVGTGLAPRFGGRLVIFAERSRLHEPAARLAAALQPNSGDVGDVALRHTIWAVRVELCSPALGTPRLEWRGCGALDAGLVATRAERENTLRDTAPWGAFGAHARLRRWLAPKLGIEGEVGGLFPLSRYSLVDQGVVEFRDTAGLSVAIGLDLRLD